MILIEREGSFELSLAIECRGFCWLVLFKIKRDACSSYDSFAKRSRLLE